MKSSSARFGATGARFGSQAGRRAALVLLAGVSAMMISTGCRSSAGHQQQYTAPPQQQFYHAPPAGSTPGAGEQTMTPQGTQFHPAQQSAQQPGQPSAQQEALMRQSLSQQPGGAFGAPSQRQGQTAGGFEPGGDF